VFGYHARGIDGEARAVVGALLVLEIVYSLRAIRKGLSR
jgi:hypothetical protein